MRRLVKNYCSNLGQRWVFAVMCFIGLFHMHAMRACLPITLTEMVAPREEVLNGSCPAPDRTNETIFHDAYSSRKIYAWSEKTQGIILSSFYWTYAIIHVPGGLIAEKYGAKHTLAFGILISIVFTSLTPWFTLRGGAVGLIIARVFLGLGQGVTYPAISVLLSRWIPPLQRSRTGSLVYAGQSLGAIFANSFSGLIIHHTGMTSSVFYIMGGLSVPWYFLWLVLCYDDPWKHPFISDAELNYLERNIDRQQQDKDLAIPWREILTSKAVWASVLGNLGFDWIALTVMTDLPKFMSSVLKIPVKNNGYITSLVFLSMWIGSIVTALLGNYVIEKQHVSVTNVRKIGSVLSLFCSACFVVGACYVGCDPLFVTVMFILAIGFSGAAIPSILVNTLDLSPNFWGIIMALSNGISTGVSGIISPYLIGVMTPHQTLIEWRSIFWIMFAIAVVTNMVFLFWGKGKIQEWNNPNFKDLKRKNESFVQTTVE